MRVSKFVSVGSLDVGLCDILCRCAGRRHTGGSQHPTRHPKKDAGVSKPNPTLVEVAGQILRDPVAVFDAGIGSYSAVATIQRRFPDQDILYLADRAAFPYGAKTLAQLRLIIDDTLDYLERRGAKTIVVASNVPSITVLPELTAARTIPICDVRPPVRIALEAAEDGNVVVLGVAALVNSTEFDTYVIQEARNQRRRVSASDASPLVELVESGAFLFEEGATQRAVTTYVRDLEASIPNVSVITLSSTHLPWLRRYFEAAAPNIRFLDPIDVILDTIAPHATVGTGTVAGVVTENPTYPSASFLAMMTQLGIDVPVEVIDGFHCGSTN